MQSKKSVLWKIWQYPIDRKLDFLSSFIEKNKIHNPEEFFAKEYPKWLYSESLLPDIDKAVVRIIKAINNNERIVIFWDYDCDWIPWTAICVETIASLWWIVSYRIPHREKDWYWMKKYFLDDLYQKKVSLLITVDNWIASFEEAEYAKKLWIDLIITDHHEIHGWKIPDALAIINPKLHNSKYPMKEICWACIAWKLMIALVKKIKSESYANKYVRDKYVDLVALSTVTDVMPLIWENRVIVAKWLEDIKKTENTWLIELFKIMNVNPWDELSADFFAFQLGPRINAAWRMSDPYFALQLLLWNKDHARYLEDLNNQRKKTVDVITKFFEKNKDSINWLVILEDSSWTTWVIWLIAWKITEKYNLPSIILHDQWNKLVASCRAPEWFNIFDFLINFKSEFIHFWWHEKACGFSIKKENYHKFKNEAKFLWNTILEKSPLINVLDLHYEIFQEEINFNFLKDLKKLEPFWHWNKKPLFLVKNISTKWDIIWESYNHIIWNIWWNRCVWFFLWEYFDDIKLAKSIDLAISLELKKWKWNDQIWIQIEDIMIN